MGEEHLQSEGSSPPQKQFIVPEVSCEISHEADVHFLFLHESDCEHGGSLPNTFASSHSAGVFVDPPPPRSALVINSNIQLRVSRLAPLRLAAVLLLVLYF